MCVCVCVCLCTCTCMCKYIWTCTHLQAPHKAFDETLQLVRNFGAMSSPSLCQTAHIHGICTMHMKAHERILGSKMDGFRLPCADKTA